MQHTMSRTLLVAVSSAGLVLGSAVSAGASDKGKDKDKGWVKVCQEVKDKKKDDKDKGKDWKKYEGEYKIRDSKGKTYTVKLEGKDKCKTKEVNKGWTRVTVKVQPDDTKLKSDKNQWVKVKEGKVKEVTFKYKVERDKKD